MRECEGLASEVLPDLPRPEQKALAALVTGVVMEKTAVISHACAGIPGVAHNRSKQRRASRLLANPRFDVSVAQGHLLDRLLQGRRGRLDLFVDATTTGATIRGGGVATVCVALGRRGRALPLLWRSFRVEESGQDWRGAIRQMLRRVQQALPEGVEVVLMADRGLSGSPLARLALSLGWHYLLRVPRTTRVRLENGDVRQIGELVPSAGSQCLLSGVKVWTPRIKLDHWHSKWEQAVVASVVAVRRQADEEAWLLITDLSPSIRRCNEYRRRTWEEELFRDLKSFGWNWQASRVRRPERVERLLLVLALATLWMLALAQRLVRRGQRKLLEEPSRRCYSQFQLGLRWLRRLLANDQLVHCYFHLWIEPPLHLKL
jgi:hypothetical protein